MKRKNSLAIMVLVICLLLAMAGCSNSGSGSVPTNIDLTGVEAQVELEQISEHVWRMPHTIETDRPNLFLVVGDKGSIMVDAGASVEQAKEFYSEVIRLELPQPQSVVLTHWHWDHSFGAAVIPAEILAHPVTVGRLQDISTWDWSDQALEERVEYGFENAYVQMTMLLELPDRSDLEIRVPDGILSDGQEFDLGGVTLRADYLRCDHSNDCVGFYIEEDDMLLIGDIMYEDYYNGPDHFSEAKVNGIINQLSEHPAAKFYGSHTDGEMSRQELLGFYKNILENEIWEFRGESWETYVMR